MAGDQIEAMSPTVAMRAMLFTAARACIIAVQLFGIDEKTQSSVSDFGRYLQHPENRKAMSFQFAKGATTSAITRAAPTCRSGSKWPRPAGHIAARWPRIEKLQQQLSKPEKHDVAGGDGGARRIPLRPAQRRKTASMPESSNTPAW